MTRIIVMAKVGPDGVLRLTLPLAAAEQDVRVTVEPITSPEGMSPAEWRDGILATSGRWQGEFERPAQGKPEEREPLG